MLVRRIVVTLSYAKNGVEKDLHSVKWQRLSQSATNRSSLTFSSSPTIREGISIRALFALPRPFAPSPSTKSTRPFYERTFSVSTFSPEGRPAILCYQQHASVHQRSFGHVNCSNIKLTSRKMKEWEPVVSCTSDLILRTIEAWINSRNLENLYTTTILFPLFRFTVEASLRRQINLLHLELSATFTNEFYELA